MMHVLRAATQSDLRVLATLGQGDIDAWSADQFAAEWGLAVSKTWVLESSAPDAPAGPAVILGCLVRWTVADETQVLNVVVHPAARRRGLGVTLMRAAIQEAKASGHSQVLLEVRADNVAAVALYKGLGFGVIGIRRSYYVQSGADAILMAYTLNA